MNGGHVTMDEPTNELDGKPDQNNLDTQSDISELNQSDLKNSECLTNGSSCESSLIPDSQDIEEPVDENTSKDTNVDSENHKTSTNTDEPEILQNKVSNGDDTTDTLIDKNDSLAVNDPKVTPINSDEHLENTESQTTSTDSQEETNENNEIEPVSMDSDIINGLESNRNSEDESCQYLQDAVDPISSCEAKEEEQNVLDKLDSKEPETGTFKIVTINRYHTDEENSSDCSGSEEEPKIEDTVSITSEGDDSRDNEQVKENEVIILEQDRTGNRNGTQSPEVHEIKSDNSDNDDCVVTGVEKVSKTPKKSKSLQITTPNSQLRRSRRAIKRKKYADDLDIEALDDESDLEEVVLEDPLGSKPRTVSKAKLLVGLPSKLKRKIIQNKKKEESIIINTPVASKNRTPAYKTYPGSHQNIYQKIAARGTSVTPISSNSQNAETKTVAPQTIQPAPEPILPTLTDDMFVVEAPSFIVPYVYEKPAVVPFKDFVEKLGKEIEEEKAKEEQELLEKKKAEKAKREQERQEKRERGEEVQESEEEDSEEVKKKKAAQKAERKERRRRKKEDDDASWDGSSSEESDDESLSDDDSQTKDNVVPLVKTAPGPLPKTDSYFDLCLGKFFIDIGSNLVQEYVQADLLHQQNRKLRREKKAGHSTRSRQVSIALLTKNLELSRKTNASFVFEQKRCKFCTFTTESSLALEHHMETPHIKNNMYICNFCSLELQSAHNVLYHMEKNHGVKGRLERALVQHQCANCPFEDHGKGKLGRHLIGCAKKFRPETNLAPPIDWEHPAKIPKLTRARAPVPYHQVIQAARLPTDIGNVRIPIGNVLTSPSYRPRAPNVLSRPTGLFIRQASPQQPSLAVGNTKKPANHAILISSSPRQASPIQPINATNAKGVVMCEICDGYIKDLEQLRNHMQWIHKVKIHPKMIYNRPPLNCQKCQFRFFTDQGLERHLLGSHGLVTSAIQEAANRGKDAGRCPVCGRAYQRKLLAHVSRDHNLVLKPAHLSYKCTVCTATFGMYRQFENHVYSAHSVVAKKAIDKKASASAKAIANDNAANQLKNNDDITMIPQPVKIGAAKGK